jgi:hypothetical protein
MLNNHRSYEEAAQQTTPRHVKWGEDFGSGTTPAFTLARGQALTGEHEANLMAPARGSGACDAVAQPALRRIGWTGVGRVEAA